MEDGQKLYAAKTVSWPGATPFCPPVCGPNPLRGFGGSRPATMHAPTSLVLCFAAYESPRSCLELFEDRLSGRASTGKEVSCPY
jgi:hypothetical protein